MILLKISTKQCYTAQNMHILHQWFKLNLLFNWTVEDDSAPSTSVSPKGTPPKTPDAEGPNWNREIGNREIGLLFDNPLSLLSTSKARKIEKSESWNFSWQPQHFSFLPITNSENREIKKSDISSTTTNFLFSNCLFRKSGIGKSENRYFFHNHNFSFLWLPIPKIGKSENRIFLPQPQLFFSPTSDSKNWEIGKLDISSTTTTFLFSNCRFRKSWIKKSKNRISEIKLFFTTTIRSCQLPKPDFLWSFTFHKN